ncbi:hypothetical protein D3C81_1861360 [compost metagenome]
MGLIDDQQLQNRAQRKSENPPQHQRDCRWHHRATGLTERRQNHHHRQGHTNQRRQQTAIRQAPAEHAATGQADAEQQQHHRHAMRADAGDVLQDRRDVSEHTEQTGRREHTHA